jgi:hypothetical protein
MTDLADFLRARYAERREQVQGHDSNYNDADGCWGLHEDPADVLADLDTKRRIVDAYAEVAEFYQPDPGERYEIADGHAAALHDVVCLFASVYANHPDYRQEWRPS